MRSPALVGATLAAVVLCRPILLAQRNPEADLKAAFVAKLPQFVEWPTETVRPQLAICAMAPPAFVQALRELTTDETVGNRIVAVRELEEDEEDIGQCQVLFFAEGRNRARRALLEQADSQPILTIGESSAFLEEGGMIALRLRDGRVRFDIDADAAKRARLQVSSQVMRLALSVRGGSP